jgi:hypothetical protein
MGQRRKRPGTLPRTRFIRRLWGRHPAQKPHSTKKGKRGYNRKRTRREAQDTLSE